MERTFLTRSVFWAFCAAGVALAATGAGVQQWFMAVFYFMFFKILVNYEKCTVSYVECKLRGVRKEDGWIYRPLHDIVTLRESRPAVLALLAVAALLTRHYFVTLGRRFVI